MNHQLISNIILILFFVCKLYLDADAQNYNLPLNDFLQYRYEQKNIYTDKHLNIKPYIIDKNYYDSLNYSIIKQKKIINLFNRCEIKPIKTTVVAYDLLNNDFISNYSYGASILGNYTKKMTYQYDFFASLMRHENYFNEFIDSTQIIPHFGKINSEFYNMNFFLSNTGYLNYAAAQYINFEIGRGKNFFGDGINSLMLSDNANSYPYLKSNVNIWKIKYIYMISKLKDDDAKNTTAALNNKYAISHLISYNAAKWLNLYFFETVISAPIDSIGAKRGLDVNYLNPMIFLRPVEFAIGTADNVIMGFGGKLKITKFHQLYGQFILDEFILSQLKQRNGWWGNKYGIQAGLKSYKTLFINNLFAQIEINLVRPYTYSHENPIRAYGNYYQPLAHHLGANFREITALLRYNYKNIYLTSYFNYAEFGTDTLNTNYGHNIYLSYNTRIQEEGNFITQGILNRVVTAKLTANYPLVERWNLYLDISIEARYHNFNQLNNKNLIFYFGFKTLLFNY